MSDDAAASARDLAPQRRQRIRSIVESRRAARLEELSASLGVSQATVRRDLDALAMEGRLRRVHGGAVALDERPSELHFDVKAVEAAAEKARIAARAVELLSPDDTVYLDSGSTVLEAAPAAPRLGPPDGGDEQPARRDGARRPRPATDRHRRGVPRHEPGARGAADPPPPRRAPRRSRLHRARSRSRSRRASRRRTRQRPTRRSWSWAGRARSSCWRTAGRSARARSSSAGRLEAIDVLVTDTGIDERVVRSLERRGVKVIKA